MIKGGPKIIEDGLVLCLDAHDAKSYAGEPTTNIQPYDGSSRFTSDSNWGTYSVRNYNGGQYFSIGTVSSISNNIVTMSSNHSLLTFDVIRAQTSGGGITAGTDYFVKKISDTQFSLHTYNNSQNGTQGYIRSDGYHQVHESIATDTKVSINATSFPTMWWGYPHLPNICYVKELRTGGGYVKGTNAMRIHVTSNGTGGGGMAYGVYVPVTAGDNITVSFWAKGSLDSKSVTYTTYFGSGNAAGSFSFTVTKEWQKFTYSWTASTTFNFYQYFFLGTDSSGPWWMDIADIQTEIGKGYSTPYTLPSSSRSTTDAWIDRSGNSSHGDFYNGLGTGASHYRDGQVIMPVANSYLEFDGTNDSIVIDDVSNISLTAGSVEAWVKMDSISGNRVIVAYGGNGTNTGWLLQSENSTSNKIGFLVFGAASAYSGNTLSTGYLNNWTHFVGTYGGGAVKFYANGALVTSTATGTNVSSSSTLRIGNEYNRSYFLDGQLGLVRIYNKTLSAAEVLSNYNATKNRFL